MVNNQTNKGPEKGKKIAYTKEFQIKNFQDRQKRSWKQLVIPMVIIIAVAAVTITLFFILRMVQV